MPVYQATKLGRIILRPASQSTNFGPYFFDIISGDEIRAAIPSFPAKFTWVGFQSTDHSSGAGGIYMHLCTGDIDDAAAWGEYDDFLADFAYIGSKPAGNPIFVDTAFGDQTETPCVNIVDGELFLTYHNSGNNDTYLHPTQNTCLSRSTDGINFTRYSVAGNPNGNLLAYDPALVRGNGHTGYFHWCENQHLTLVINPATSQPWSYIGYSLMGGGGWGYSAMWVSENAINWEVYNFGKQPIGRPVEDLVDPLGHSIKLRTLYNPKNFRPIAGSDRVRCIVQVDKDGASGNDLQYAQVAEIILEADGQTIVTKASQPPLIPRGTSGQFDEGNVAIPTLVNDGASDYITYYASDANHVNSVAIASVTEVAGDLNSLAPTKATENRIDFTQEATLPIAGITVEGEGTTFNLTSDGLEITITAGGEARLLLDASFDSSTAPIVDLMIEGLVQNNTISTSDLLGFYQDGDSISVGPRAFTILAAAVDGIKVSPRIYAQDSLGATTRSVDSFDRIGLRSSYILNQEESPTAPVDYGLRWIPPLNKMWLLSTISKSERESIDMTTFADGVYRPMYRLQNNSNAFSPSGTTIVTIKAITYGDTATVGLNATPTADVGTTPINVNGAGSTPLDGSASSDPDAGDTLTYLWEVIQGAGATIDNANASVTTLNYPNTTQEIQVQLTVTDDGDPNLSDTAIKVINVTEVISSDLTITDIGIPDGGYQTFLEQSNGTVEYDELATYSGGTLSLANLELPVGTTLKGYVIDNENPHVNGAVLVGVTE